MRLLFLACLASFLVVELKMSASPQQHPRFSDTKTPEERCADGVWLVRTGDYDQGAAELIIRRSCLNAD